MARGGCGVQVEQHHFQRIASIAVRRWNNEGEEILERFVESHFTVKLLVCPFWLVFVPSGILVMFLFVAVAFGLVIDTIAEYR